MAKCENAKWGIEFSMERIQEMSRISKDSVIFRRRGYQELFVPSDDFEKEIHPALSYETLNWRPR